MQLTPPARAAPPVLANGIALHRQIFLVLRDEIGRRAYAPGSALPKEEALCVRFGVSRITVRRALADLAAQGLVERRQGLGNFVRTDLPEPRQRPTLGFIEGLRKTAIDTQVEVLGVERLVPPAEVAQLLGTDPAEKAVHALRLRSIDGTPVMLTDAWVPARLGKKVTVAALRKHALYELLLAQGVQLGRVVQEISALAADPVRAAALKTEVGSALLKVVRLVHGRDSRPVEYLTFYLSPERSRIMMDITIDDVNTLGTGQVVHDFR